MARLKGLLKIEGTLDEMTFYKTQDGHLVKTKGGVSADRIANDPNFQRTRENGAEFGSSASAGKLLRDAIRNLLMNTADNRVTSRLTQVMTNIKNLDITSARGERVVGVAIATPAAKALLKGFNFNINAILGAILFKPFTVNPVTGQIDINGLVPVNDIDYPSGATHMTVKGAWAKVDFTTGVFSVEQTNAVNLLIDGTVTNVSVLPAIAPTGPGTDIYLLSIEFYQEVNAVQYSLKNGSYNALSIVEVA